MTLMDVFGSSAGEPGIVSLVALLGSVVTLKALEPKDASDPRETLARARALRLVFYMNLPFHNTNLKTGGYLAEKL